jgi:prolyl-tRNA editing enzyme YbaK/EbsC (Cys-tRNA(Pro) deacylase)
MKLETNDDYQQNNPTDPTSKLTKRINLDYQHLKMVEYFLSNKAYSYKIVEADSSYYSLNLKQRQQVLGAHTTDVLCKTIILENTAFDKQYESEYYQKFYLAIVQYEKEFNGDKIMKSMKAIQNQHSSEKLSNKYFHFRLAKDEVAYDMTGYRFNCITPYLMKDEKVHILFPKNLLHMNPLYFWIGGGELELKVGLSIDDFMRLYGKRVFTFDLSSAK